MEDVERKRNSFSALLEQYHAGDPDAMSELYTTYNDVIRTAVRRRLPQRLRQEFDSIDFTQDVWASFCMLPEVKYRFADQDAFEGYLGQMAYNKVLQKIRTRNAARQYGQTREETLAPIASPDPTPSQWAIAGERWADIASRLPPSHLAIVKRIREGYSRQEVADMAGITLRTVTRILGRIHRDCGDSS